MSEGKESGFKAWLRRTVAAARGVGRATADLWTRMGELRAQALDEVVSRLAKRPVRTTPEEILKRRRRIEEPAERAEPSVEEPTAELVPPLEEVEASASPPEVEALRAAEATDAAGAEIEGPEEREAPADRPKKRRRRPRGKKPAPTEAAPLERPRPESPPTEGPREAPEIQPPALRGESAEGSTAGAPPAEEAEVPPDRELVGPPPIPEPPAPVAAPPRGAPTDEPSEQPSTLGEVEPPPGPPPAGVTGPPPSEGTPPARGAPPPPSFEGRGEPPGPSKVPESDEGPRAVQAVTGGEGARSEPPVEDLGVTKGEGARSEPPVEDLGAPPPPEPRPFSPAVEPPSVAYEAPPPPTAPGPEAPTKRAAEGAPRADETTRAPAEGWGPPPDRDIPLPGDPGPGWLTAPLDARPSEADARGEPARIAEESPAAIEPAPSPRSAGEPPRPIEPSPPPRLETTKAPLEDGPAAPPGQPSAEPLSEEAARAYIRAARGEAPAGGPPAEPPGGVHLLPRSPTQVFLSWGLSGALSDWVERSGSVFVRVEDSQGIVTDVAVSLLRGATFVEVPRPDETYTASLVVDGVVVARSEEARVPPMGRQPATPPRFVRLVTPREKAFSRVPRAEAPAFDEPPAWWPPHGWPVHGPGPSAWSGTTVEAIIESSYKPPPPPPEPLPELVEVLETEVLTGDPELVLLEPLHWSVDGSASFVWPRFGLVFPAPRLRRVPVWVGLLPPWAGFFPPGARFDLFPGASWLAYLGWSGAFAMPGASEALPHALGSAAFLYPGASVAFAFPGASRALVVPGASGAFDVPGASGVFGVPGASAAFLVPGASERYPFVGASVPVGFVPPGAEYLPPGASRPYGFVPPGASVAPYLPWVPPGASLPPGLALGIPSSGEWRPEGASEAWLALGFGFPGASEGWPGVGASEGIPGSASRPRLAEAMVDAPAYAWLATAHRPDPSRLERFLIESHPRLPPRPLAPEPPAPSEGPTSAGGLPSEGSPPGAPAPERGVKDSGSATWVPPHQADAQGRPEDGLRAEPPASDTSGPSGILSAVEGAVRAVFGGAARIVREGTGSVESAGRAVLEGVERARRSAELAAMESSGSSSASWRRVFTPFRRPPSFPKPLVEPERPIPPPRVVAVHEAPELRAEPSAPEGVEVSAPLPEAESSAQPVLEPEHHLQDATWTLPEALYPEGRGRARGRLDWGEPLHADPQAAARTEPSPSLGTPAATGAAPPAREAGGRHETAVEPPNSEWGTSAEFGPPSTLDGETSVLSLTPRLDLPGPGSVREGSIDRLIHRPRLMERSPGGARPSSLERLLERPTSMEDLPE